jgi:type IV fimbrial biogenesis protein FimT
MRRVTRNRVQAGWTLVELMIALAIAGILVSWAGSAATGAIQAARCFEAHAALLRSLNGAQLAAGLRERDVRICPSADGASCTGDYRWERGWVTYVDANDNNRLDPADIVLERQGALAPGVRVITSTGRRSLEFQPSAGNGGSNATFTFCDRRGAAKAKAFALGNTGGLREVPATPAAVQEACRR